MPDTYALLLDLRRSEAAARGLAKIPHDFYGATTAYLAELRRTYEAELRENPSGRRGELARQTHQRASQVARDLIEARMTKILSLSFQASVGGAKDVPNSLPEERALFDALTGLLSTHRATVAPYLVPGNLAAPSAPTPMPPVPAPPRAAPPTIAPRSALVRILRDGKPIAVGEETIEPRKEDLLSVPEEIAKLLIETKIAEAVDVPPRAV